MKRTLTIGVATVALLLAGAGVALAQEVPKPVTITAAKACGVVTLTFVNPNEGVARTMGFRWNAVAGKVSTADGIRTGVVTVPPLKTVKETIRFEEDEFGGEAAVTVAAAFGPDAQPQFPDVYPVDTDCAAPTTPPTTPPTTTPVPPPPVDEFDCDDFATRTAAQAKLDETPGADPHRLDADGDRVACELELPASNTPVPTPVVVPGYSQVSVVPVGGVATGA